MIVIIKLLINSDKILSHWSLRFSPIDLQISLIF